MSFRYRLHRTPSALSSLSSALKIRSQQGTKGGIVSRCVHFAIFLKGVPNTTTESMIRQEFEVFGPIRQVKIFQVSDEYKCANATVHFQYAYSALSAVDFADEQIICGRKISVDFNINRIPGSHNATPF